MKLDTWKASTGGRKGARILNCFNKCALACTLGCMDTAFMRETSHSTAKMAVQSASLLDEKLLKYLIVKGRSSGQE